ncbi:hypothetical protein ASPZODRAFT_137365 [Penicilliopsis zonata CBS 506.65]|uniref:AB hydrolase-1 domain-containing protein n=1 Tax=Penicilliopsis zonata CBS 506.65 TaxID=1073090 RepID=A0A1L9S535_9EURO|nr:hypothetical protein ASPZODRAFT_137365 [Penicilliopsis zonata CBS 506.65]OJJ42272.1 hypothetical protein ASPZODRAFT_137365 [Penicilliopsis zonata CBS 506.65]
MPSVLFVPGAWCPPSLFDPVRLCLAAKGISSSAIALPSVGGTTATLDDDIAAVRAELLKYIDEKGEEIILAAHSYGGVVASGAAEGLTKNDYEGKGKRGGVVRIVYMAAFVAPKGASMKQLFGGEFPPSMRVEDDRVYAVGGADLVFHDIPPEEQTKWLSVLTYSSLASFNGPATYEPWHTTPSAFIISEEDHAFPPAVQEQMAQALGTESVYRVKGSHSAFLSQPERVAEILEELSK